MNLLTAVPTITRLLVGLLLFVAGFAKLNEGLDTQYGSLLTIVAIVELSFAAWGLSGIWRSQFLWASLALFTSFAAFNMTGSDEGGCRCFGARYSLPSGVALLLNVGVACLLASAISCSHSSNGVRHSWRRRVAVAATALTVVVLSTSVAKVIKTTASPQVAMMLSDAKGRRVDSIFESSINTSLGTGDWVVVAVSSRCPACYFELERYRKFWDELSSKGRGEVRFAFIEVDVNIEEERQLLRDGDFYLNGRLLKSHVGRLPTPVSFFVKDGRIILVSFSQA